MYTKMLKATSIFPEKEPCTNHIVCIYGPEHLYNRHYNMFPYTFQLLL